MVGNIIKTNQGTFIVIDKILYPETYWIDTISGTAIGTSLAVTYYICICKGNKKKTVLINPRDITEIL